MNNHFFRFSWSHLLLVFVCALLLSEDSQGGTPSYQNLTEDRSFVATLQSPAKELSRFPTVFSAAWTTGGQSIRSIDIDGRIFQQEYASPAVKTEIGNTGTQPCTAAISNDGVWLAVADHDGSVSLINLDTNKRVLQDHGQNSRAVSLCFSEDGTRLCAVTVAGNLRVWTVPDGELVCQYTVAAGAVQSITISRDRSTVAVAANAGVVRLLPTQMDSTNMPRKLLVGESRVTCIAFTADGEQLVCATANGEISVHDLTSQLEPIQLTSSPFPTWSISFNSPGNQMISGSVDGTVNVWNAETWERLQSVKQHGESVIATRSTPQHGLLSAGADGRLLLWQFRNKEVVPLGSITGRDDAAWVALHSPDGKRLFVGGEKNRFEFWGTEPVRLQVTRNGPPVTRCAAYSRDGKQLVVGSNNGTVLLYDANSGELVKKFKRHALAVSFVLFSDDDRSVISGSDDGDVQKWDAVTGALRSSQREHRNHIYCGTLSPDQNWLVTGGGHWQTDDPGEIVVWNQKTGDVHAKLKGHRLAVWSIVFLDDGKHFAASDSTGAVNVWDLESGTITRTLRHGTWVRGLALSGDRKTLAVGVGDGSIALWNTETWQRTATCSGSASFAFSLQYAPDGKTLVSANSDGGILFWNP